ncbi:RDD family protein [uncultured Jatrophihabitans sp.]|uniref:RDD family protein n=1 Tax=uncultured Jatrophihabitans sp. TaxID=1610747 RepID=UPI0035C9E1C6
MTDFGKHDPSDPNQPPHGGGQPPHGQPPHGQPPHGQPPHGQPPQGPPPGQQPQGGGHPPQGQQGSYTQQGQQPQGGFPPPPQGNYGQPGSAPPPVSQGGYPSAPVAPAGYAPPGYYFHQESGLTLPVGTELASRGRRIGAYFLAIPLILVTLVIGYLIWGLVLWGKGTSPALRVLGMRCYKPVDGRSATFGTMALRDIVGVIVQQILSIITGLISFILFLSSAKRQSLPDLIGGTVVLYDPNKVLD